MYRSNIYLKMMLLVSFFVLALNSVFAQPSMELKLQLIGPNEWGVYVRPIGITPSTGQTITIGGNQITLVTPLNYPITNFTNVNGIWQTNATVNGPLENPGASYISFGFSTEITPIPYQAGTETLLFTFKGNGICPDSLHLIEIGDPFDIPGNTQNSNPGNEYAVFDMVQIKTYSLLGLYSPYAWDCHDCDGDGILNAFEDSDGDGVYVAFNEDLNNNGILDLLHEDLDNDGYLDQGEDVNHNGVLDPGEDKDGDGVLDLTEDLNNNGVFNLPLEDIDGDGHFDNVNEDTDGDHVLDLSEDADGDGYLDPDASQICNPCDPFHPESAALELIGGADVICAGDVGDTAWFKVTIEGGWPPYTLNYTDGTTAYQELLYYSGDSIPFVPTISTTLSITSVVDSFLCLLDTTLGAPITFSVHGPISITDEPDPVTECFGNGTQFCIDFDNAGDGYTYRKWQVSTNNGSTWADIQDGSVYDNTDSLCMDIANVANKHNFQYRCKIFTDVCDTVYSIAALLQVEGPITISTHPSDFTNCETEDASFTAASVNAGAVGTMVYQWQESADGITWNDISGATAGATHSTFTATTLNLTGISVSLDGHYYRMKVSTGECAFVYTNPARLNVSGAITVTDDPDNISNCAGSEINFIAAFANAGASYPVDPQQTVTSHIWQISDTGAPGTWSNLTNAGNVYTGITGTDTGAGASDTLTISNVVGLNGKWYRICYTTATCSVPVYSAAAQLQVSGNVSFSVDPKDATVCSGNDTTFFATASIPQGTFTYGWEYSDDNGDTWIPIDFVVNAALFQHTQTGTISAGTDILTVSNVASMYGRRFRAVANATDCNSVYSNYAILSVEGPLAESVVPVSVTECSGNPTTFLGGFTNPGVAGSTIYRWQVSVGGGPWADLANGIPYGGAGTNQLTITNVAGLHGNCYRLSARTSTCNKIFGTSACLTVEGPITVAAQPVTVDLCSGDGTSFTSTANVGTAGTLTYQWQLLNNSNAWEDITGASDGSVYTNFTTTTLNVSNVAGLYNRCYRLAFSTGTCLLVFSDPACMNIDGPLSITAHPDDIVQCSGEGVIFGAKAASASLETNNTGLIQYQWQCTSTDTVTGWKDIVNDTLYNGSQTDTMSITYTSGLDGNHYRMKIWTDNCDTVFSYAALLDVEGPMYVTQEPLSISECAGSGVTFQSTVGLDNGDPLTLIYQWEVSAYNTGTMLYGPYTNVVDGGVFSGATTTTLSISDVAGMYNYRYRLRYRTPNCDAQWSNYATLTVEGPIDFNVGGHPDDVVECSGNPVVFNVVTTNNNPSVAIAYQWQILFAGLDSTVALNWVNLNNGTFYNGSKTSTLSISNVAGFNGHRYRVLIQTPNCSSAASYSALLTVEGPLSFTDHPDDITQCSGEGVTFTAASEIALGNAGTMTYQWQWSDNASCVNYSNITAAGVNGFSGWNTPTLTVGNVAGINGRCFRLGVRTGECNYIYSLTAKLTVEGPLTITGQPIDYTNCSDKEAFFYSQINNPAVGGQDAVLKQWQWSNDGGNTWSNIVQLVNVVGSDTINIGGYDSDTIFIAPIKGLNGYMFRNIFWTETCNRDTTNAATLTVEGPVTFTIQPEDVQTCFGDTVRYNIAIDNSTGEGVVQYQWQRFVSGSWTDLTNSAPFSGATTQQLTISPNYTNLYNAKFRCKVKTANCDWEFSDLANLFLEGPVTFDLQPIDASVCSNKPHLFNTTITNPGYGQMTFRWWYKKPSGAWTAFPSNIGNLDDAPLSVVNPTDADPKWQGAYGQDLNLTNVDGLNGWQFRLQVIMPNCGDVTNEVTLTVRDKCLSGDCDLDNDGLINDLDLDDDNDQLADYWEAWMTTNNVQVSTTDFAGTGPWYYTNFGVVVPSPATPVLPNAYISYDRCLVDTDNDGVFDNQEDPDGDNINNGEETDGDIVFDGNPLDPCSPVLGPTCIGINLAIKVGLQGAHIGVPNSDTLMRASLHKYGNPSQQLIPTKEPYTAITNSFLHNGPDGGGTEVVTDSTTIFGVDNKDAIVDWVFVELRSSTSLDSVATTRAGLLQRDGDVVDLDGVSNLRFPNASANTYYVSVRHRNHLGVMTGEALDLSPALQEIDFTDPSFITNGTYPQVQLGNRMYMWCGDLNSDGRTVYQGPGNDILKLFITVLYDSNNTTQLANFINQGYRESDINLDGRSIYQGPNNDRSMLLLNAILSHPANNTLISNFVILEMLP